MSATSQSVKRGKLMTWKIPKSTIKNWTRLSSNVPKEEAVDCVINSLHVLGVLKNRVFSEAIAEKVNVKKTGLMDKEILSIIYEYLNRKEGVYSLETKTTAGLHRANVDHLKNGEYTFAALRGIDMGHAVVIYKHNNQVYVFDPQQEQTCSEKILDEQIKLGIYTQVDFLYYEKVARYYPKTDSTTDTNTKKKQKTVFDKYNVVFAMGKKSNTKKQKTKATAKTKKRKTRVKTSIHSLTQMLGKLQIE